MARGHFSSGVREVLTRRAGGRCSNPSCRRQTLGPSQKGKDKAISVGVAAHIKAASPGGARYDADQSEEERHSAENGLWLCESCGALVDKNNGADFSTAELIIWKRASEKAAFEALARAADRVKENCVSTLVYINVPRLTHFARLTQPEVRVPSDCIAGIPEHGYIVPELVGLERAIELLDFPALDWAEAAQLVDDPTGMLVSFEGRFWTKNGVRSGERYKERDFSDLKTAPHIYAKREGLRFILPYDPRFLTTNTAGVEFASGQVRVGGFAVVKKKDGADVWASPLLIGLSSTPEARAFMAALSGNN